MEFNLADLFEAAVDAYPEREYLVADGERRTYAEMEARANRLAHHLAAQGIGPGDHVGIYAYNSVEWVETAWAVFKLRAIWININYRYVKDELRYLLTNADLKALVHQREFSPLVTALLPELPDLRHVIVIEDGSDVDPTPGAIGYEEALADQSPERDFGPRTGDDLYILYTGGTTGMPKGVVWRHEDVFYALGGGTDPVTNAADDGPGGDGGQGGGRPDGAPAGGATHARRDAVVRHGPELRRLQDRAHGQVRPPPRLAARRRGAGELGDDHGRRHGQAARRVALRPRDGPRPLVAPGRRVVGRAVLGTGQGPVLRPPAQPRDHRRHRLVGGREQRDDGGDRRATPP